MSDRNDVSNDMYDTQPLLGQRSPERIEPTFAQLCAQRGLTVRQALHQIDMNELVELGYLE